MENNENSQVLPALEALRRFLETSPLQGNERLELLMAVGYLQKQRLCGLDRRDPEEKVWKAWMGFERRFAGVPVSETFRMTNPGWTCLRDFFRPRRGPGKTDRRQGLRILAERHGLWPLDGRIGPAETVSEHEDGTVTWMGGAR